MVDAKLAVRYQAGEITTLFLVSQGQPMASDPITAPITRGAALGIAQPVAAPLARYAIFLVVTLKSSLDSRTIIRSFCGDLSALLRRATCCFISVQSASICASS